MPRDDDEYAAGVAAFEAAHGKVRIRRTKRHEPVKVELTAEAAFEQAWLANPLPGFTMVREYRFDEVRKWRFDAAWPEQRVAVELNGWGQGGHVGRHHTFLGARGDCEKMTAAAVKGWRVLHFMSADKKNASAWVASIKMALSGDVK